VSNGGIVGDDFLRLYDEKVFYKDVPNFEWLQIYGCLRLRIQVKH